MNRSGKFNKVTIKPDPVYNSIVVHKFINKIMRHGEKAIASKIAYSVLEMIENFFKEKGNDTTGDKLLSQALDIVKPKVFLRSKRIASKVYKVPIEIKPYIALNKSMMWLIHGARSRKDRTIINKLFYELKDILMEEKGESIKFRDNYHRIAKENEAFIHYV